MLSLTLVLAPANLSAQTTAGPADAAIRFRARIVATPIGAELEVTLEGGEKVEGELDEVEAESFGVWVEVEEATRKQLNLTSGRLKKWIRYDQVVEIRGAAAEVALSGEELAFRMRIGDSVRIHTREGDEVRGPVESFDGDLLRVDTRSFHLSQGDVQRIERKVQDSLVNGALIGLGVGVGWTALACSSSGECDASAATVVAIILGGGCAGLGALFDALRTGTEVVYVGPARSDRTRFGVAPLLTSDKKGLLVSLQF